MKEGNVLVIAIGGNITQILMPNDNSDPTLKPATDEEIRKFILGDNNKTSSLILHDGNNNSKGVSIRVQVERLYETHNIEQQDSSQVNPKIWSDLVERIRDNEKNYEGFVVLHGLDTLAYTASAVSFMIRNQKMPIVFTGSQRPLNYVRTDAPQNIFTAITLAASKSLEQRVINEVTIYLHDTLYRANRSSMSSASSYRSFDSLNYPALVTIGEHIDIKEHLISVAEKPGNMGFSLPTNANVQIVDVFPGMSPRVIEGLVGDDLDLIYIDNLKQQALKITQLRGEIPDNTDEIKTITEIENKLCSNKQPERLSNLLPEKERAKAFQILSALDSELQKDDIKMRGVILRTYGMGTAPTNPDVLNALKRLVEKGVIVMNVTQAHSSKVSFNSDPVSLRLLEQGVISGLDMTSEASFAKMVVILSDSDNWEKGKEYCEQELHKDIAGEQSHSIINLHFKKGETVENYNSDDLFAKLEFTNKEKEAYPKKSDNIQLRILGLRKKELTGGKTVEIKFIRCDNENKDLSKGDIVLKKDVVFERKKSENSDSKTINVSFDISGKHNNITSKNSVFYILSDQAIEWSRISFVIYC